MPVRTLLRRFAIGCAAYAGLGFALTGKPIASQGTPGVGTTGAEPVAVTAPMFEETPGEPQYDTSFTPLPPNVPSVGFEATGTSEFGDLVRLAEHAHYIDSVTVTMSSWAIRSDFPGAAPLGFTHPVTLKLYRVDRSTGVARAGDPLATISQSFLIPWRPEPDVTSRSPLRPWRGADGNLYTGRAFTLTFDVGALGLTLPDEIIFGVSFNTENFGAAPLRVPGPYNALHVGVAVEPPRAGADLEPDAVFWKTASRADYADAGAAGANIFRRDTAWTPFKPAVRFNNSPYGMLASVSARLGGLPAADATTAATLERAYTLTQWALERRLWDGYSRLQPAGGRLVFDLLAEAVDELGELTPATRGQTMGEATGSLWRIAESLAELAVGDALIGGGNAARFAEAQDALDEAHRNVSRGRLDRAIDELGNAWREAALSLR